AAGGEDERRIDDPDVPPRVASRVLVARGQEHTAALIEPVDERLDRVRDGNLLDRSVDADASPSVVRRGGHDLPPPCEESADSGRQKDESRPEWAAPFSLGSALVRARAGRGRPQGDGHHHCQRAIERLTFTRGFLQTRALAVKSETPTELTGVSGVPSIAA